MVRLNVQNTIGIYNLIHTTEEMLAEQEASIGNKREDYKKRKNDFKRNEWKNEKYCSFHKTKTHDSSNCRVMNKNIKEKKEDHSDRNAFIQEPIIHSKVLEIEGSINDHNSKFLIDTGSSKTYVKEEIAENLKLRTTGTSEPLMF